MWRVVTCMAAMLAGASAGIIVYTQDRMIAEEFRDMPASFGPDLPLDGMTGLVVAGEPEDGCAPLAKPPPDDNFTGRWIVVVARFNCSFEEKVRNAQAAGYHCVIVHNVNSSDLETMSAKDPEGITIPSVFVGDVAGLLLREDYNYTSGYFVMVNGDLPFNINTHLLLPFAIVVVICLLVILVFMIVKCIKDRRRARRHRLPNRCLRKIPTCKFSKGDPYDTCAICLDDYVEGERLRVLPCAHAYHAKCIDPWLTQNRRVCPVCKRKVMAAGERRRQRERDSDSDSDDTEPLITSTPEVRTQGGTFEEQRENPFVRAARFMARLRRARDTQQTHGEQEAPPPEEPEPDENANDEIPSSDSAPLLAPQPALVTERERRSSSRSGRAHSTRSRRARAVSAPTPQPETATPTDQLAQTDTHSINGDTSASTGQIGVAALPAPRDGAITHPGHINL